MSFADQAKDNLLNIIQEMSLHPEDFSRNRKLDFCTLLHLILSMQTGTLKDELYKYFSYQTSTASTSAFLQQRSKLADNAFPYLFHSFNELYPYKSNIICWQWMVLPLHLPEILSILILILLQIIRPQTVITRYM